MDNTRTLHSVNGDRISLNTGLTPRLFGPSVFGRYPEERGFLLPAVGDPLDWRFDDAHEGSDGLITLQGPGGYYVPLFAVLAADRAAGWAILRAFVARTASRIRAGGEGAERVAELAIAGPGAILVDKSGDFLVAPPALCRRAARARKPTELADHPAFWTHPDAERLDPTASYGFLIGALAYRVIAGIPPFPAKAAEEDIFFAIRGGFFEPLRLAVPAASPELDQAISELLTARSDDPVGLAESLSAELPALPAAHEPAHANARSNAALAERERAASRRAQAEGRARFLSRHRRTILISAAVAVLGISFLAYLIRGISSRPTTEGLAPREVVEGFYAAVDRLDQEIPAAYRSKGAGESYVSMTREIYVTGRIKESNERDAGIISPEDLIVTGKLGGRYVFGLTRIRVEEIETGPTRARYAVSFYLWKPEAPSEAELAERPNATVSFSVSRGTDEVTVERGKRGWKIVEISESERERVADPARLAADADAAATGALPYGPSADELDKAREAAEPVEPEAGITP